MRKADDYRELTEKALIPALNSLGTIPQPLPEAMTYSMTAGGKRIRPVLLLATCEMAGGDIDTAMPYACALEMIHTYSLIHDDLPAMDNDDLRRGKPTNHKVFGEGMAVLAGDGLLNAAAELMAVHALKTEDIRGIRAMEIILRHAGITGMIAGQVADVTSEGMEPREETVRYIQEHKTADLLEAAVEAGLALAGAEPEQIAAGHEYALHLGMLFQMTDDLLDVTSTAEVLGKTPGKDLEQKKMTWIALRGLEGTEEEARREADLSMKALEALPWDTAFLAEFVQKVLHRIK